MKKLCSFLLVLSLMMGMSAGATALEPEDEILAEAAVLIDAETGQVLYDKNMNARKYPASTTKILTGLLVVENCDLGETVTVSDEAVDLPYGTSNIALTTGEQLSVDSAMYALMLPSANDAANALAEHVAGTQGDFAKLMNQRAKEAGAKGTHFSNSHGLPDTGHYTTAYDMAMITREAIRNEKFLKYFGTGRHTIPATNLQEEERPLTNQQFMLLPDQDWAYNPDVIGGKVGYTEESRHTMSTAATKNGVTLVAVVMGCGIDQKFDDTQALFDFGFDNFKKVTVAVQQPENVSVPVLEAGEEVGKALFTLPEEVSLLLPKGISAEDVTSSAQLPDFFEKKGPYKAALTLSGRDPADGEAVALLEMSLDPVLSFSDSGGGKKSTGNELAFLTAPSAANNKGQGFVLVLAVAACWAVCAVVSRRKKLKVKAERRRKRLHALQKESDEGVA